MARAVICPVCDGAGKIDEDYPGAGKSNERICHGCGGKGWVEVADGVYPMYPFVIKPYYPVAPCDPYYYQEPSTGDPIPSIMRFYCYE